jgi:hypothetical protein
MHRGSELPQHLAQRSPVWAMRARPDRRLARRGQMAAWSATGIPIARVLRELPMQRIRDAQFSDVRADRWGKATALPAALRSAQAIALAVRARPTRMRPSRWRDGAARLAIERKAPWERCSPPGLHHRYPGPGRRQRPFWTGTEQAMQRRDLSKTDASGCLAAADRFAVRGPARAADSGMSDLMPPANAAPFPVLRDVKRA